LFFAADLLSLLHYAGSFFYDQDYLNFTDDFHAYFVFPNKMLQMGSMGPDPFSARRLESALGGQTFLDTFILSMLSEQNLNSTELGWGLIIVVGLILGYLKEKNISKRTGVFILILFLLIYIPKVNTTSLVIALALFLSLFRILDWEKLRFNHFIANAFIVALVTAAICALKSNLIPSCIILFTLSYLFYIFGSRIQRKAIYEFFIATLLVGLFLLPWMLSMYQSSGTLLYPFLGQGYHGTVHVNPLSPLTKDTIIKTFKIVKQAVTSIDFLLLCVLSYLVLRRRKKRIIGREAPLSLLLSAGVGTILIVLATGGYQIPFHSFSSRYSYSFTVAAIIILILIILNKTERRNRVNSSPFNSVTVVTFLAGLLIASSEFRAMYGESIHNIKLGLNNVALVSKQEVEQYTKMLQTIPKDQTILTRLEKPFLLNFSQNKIFIADWPGGASPPPSLPTFKGSEPLADYLTSKAIRYVAYSYVNEAGWSRKNYGYLVKPEIHIWSRNEARYTFDFQDNLKQLGETRKRIYDDGENFVLDLLSRELTANR